MIDLVGTYSRKREAYRSALDTALSYMPEVAIENAALRLLSSTPLDAMRLARATRNNASALIKTAYLRKSLWGRGLNAVLQPRKSFRSPAVLGDDRNIVAAFPLSLGALVALEELVKNTPRQFVVLRTVLTDLILDPLLADRQNVRFMPVSEMARQKFAPTAEPTVWVTFPDQTMGTKTSNEIVTMFGREFLFQAIEPLLWLKHRATLLRYELTPDGYLARFELAEERSLSPKDKVSTVMSWLATGIERAVSERPEEYLGWTLLARKEKHVHVSMHERYVDLIIGYLRSWRIADPQAADTVCRLLTLAETERSGIADRLFNKELSVSAAGGMPQE